MFMSEQSIQNEIMSHGLNHLKVETPGHMFGACEGGDDSGDLTSVAISLP